MPYRHGRLTTSRDTIRLTMMDSDEDDDMPVLSGAALAALQNFYVDRDKQLDDFEQLRMNKNDDLTIADFKEDWNTSQFWFTDKTAAFLADQLLEGITSESTIAIVSAPSVFMQMKRILVNYHISSCAS